MLREQFPDSKLEHAGVFWMQGESDAGAPRSANAYESNLKNFIESIRHSM